jgi:hypothetical protein
MNCLYKLLYEHHENCRSFANTVLNSFYNTLLVHELQI